MRLRNTESDQSIGAQRRDHITRTVGAVCDAFQLLPLPGLLTF